MSADVADELRRDLARSITLFRAFLREQSDPEHFYAILSRDSVDQVEQFGPLSGVTVVDVGGGRGYFRNDFTTRGARYVADDPDVDEVHHRGSPAPGTILGDGMRLPIRDSAVDVCFSSNALEHVPRPEQLADEMVRVTRPGGLIYLSYCNWLSPNGGHETKPWHLFIGGRRAADRYARRVGHRPKNDFGHTLFNVSAAQMLRWVAAAQRDGRVSVERIQPRYHPRIMRWVIDVPGLRELATWNVLLVLRRRPG